MRTRIVRWISWILAVVLVVAALWNYAAHLLAWYGYYSWGPRPTPPASILFCWCPLSGLLFGIALAWRAPRLATWATVLFVVYPLAGLLDSLLVHRYDAPFHYRLVMAVAIPFGIATGLFRPLHVLPALGTAFILYFVKNVALLWLAVPEVPVWTLWLFGPPSLRRLYMPISVSALVLGLVLLGAGLLLRWAVLRRRARRSRA